MVNCIKIIRPVNVAITGCAVILGAWITSAQASAAAILTAIAAMAAVAYGNTVNDILDVKSDRVSHPNRPLAKGAMSKRSAAALAVGFVIVALACAARASTFHLLAALAPIALLTLYSIYFKRMPIVGNIVVASLTAYALVYGSLPKPETKILIAPAVLAFLLNFCRELVKDVQDAAGDGAAGWRTSASLPLIVIRVILTVTAVVYSGLALTPSLIFEHFGKAYTIVCLTAVIPLHIYWTLLACRPRRPFPAGKIERILKLEMAAGLAALALDRIF